MIPYERRQRILEMMNQKEIVFLDEFCKNLPEVSESTIRRDLKGLASEGEIIILHGGGARLKRGAYDIPFESKNMQNIDAKEKIARYAASLVQDGESIYMDAGSTVFRMITYMHNKEINIITTNALILSHLGDSKIKCFVAGGELQVSTASILGTVTNNFLQNNYFDKAFLGVSGFSSIAGMSTPDYRESEKKKIVRRNSEKSYVLVDSSKDGVNSLSKVFELGEVPIICEKETETLRKCGNYIIAK